MDTIYIDVSETLRVSFTSGIQRTVKEFSRRIIKSLDNVKLIRHIPGTKKYKIIDSESFETYCSGKPLEFSKNDQFIFLDDIDRSDIFLDLDAVWNKDEERRYNIYKRLKQHDVTVMTLVYDVLPIQFPHFFHQETLWHYITWFSAVLEYSDFIIVNSNATKHRIEEFSQNRKIPQKNIIVVPLGADFKDKSSEEEISELVREAAKSPFLMMLGTIEPRKNHVLLLDAFDEILHNSPINIVIAGRIGWNVDEIVKRIKSHPDLGKRAFFLEYPNDAEVAYLYEQAYGLVFASFGEGFGLPIVEAMYHKKLIFASDIEVFREIGEDRCLYFDPHDPKSLAAQVNMTLDNAEIRTTFLNKVQDYHVSSWDEAAIVMQDAIREGEKKMVQTECSEVNAVLSQMFMISARKDDLLETLPFYEHFMPWIKELVLCCPERLKPELDAAYQGPIHIKYLTDESLMNGKPLPKDHVTRNFLLRCLAVRTSVLNDVFIMADDDNRPMRPIPVEYFIKDGKFRLFYCFEDMCQWQGYIAGYTSYDHGIDNTAKLLHDNGLPTVQYSSHEPQVICKRIFIEALERFPEVIGSAFESWGLYGNYATAYYKNFFVSLPYTTMCWPGLTTDWKVTVPPKEYWFENFYPALYEEGKIFFGFSRSYHDHILEENMSKAQLRMAQQNEYDKGIAVSEACDAIYYEKYNSTPDWIVDLEWMKISVPRELTGRRGFIKKAPLRIKNSFGHKHLQINGYFTENGTGKIYPFHKLDIDTTDLNGEYVLIIHYPPVKCEGMFHIIFCLDERKKAEADIPFKTYGD